MWPNACKSSDVQLRQAIQCLRRSCGCVLPVAKHIFACFQGRVPPESVGFSVNLDVLASRTHPDSIVLGKLDYRVLRIVRLGQVEDENIINFVNSVKFRISAKLVDHGSSRPVRIGAAAE